MSSLNNYLKKSFTSQSIQRGVRYFKSGSVLSVTKKGEDVYSSKVSGSYGASYEQRIMIQEQRFSGTCTCPMVSNCKHVVAAIYYIEDNKDRFANDNGKNSDNSPMEHQLPSPTNDWLKELEKNILNLNKSTKVKQIRQVIYILDSTGKEGKVSLKPYTLVFTAEGDVREINDLSVSGYSKTSKYITNEDRKILSAISSNSSYSDHILNLTFGETPLLMALKTGRCYWKEYSKTPLTLADEMFPLELSWMLREDGLQKMHFICDKVDFVLNLIPAYGIIKQENKIVPLSCDFPDSIMEHIHKMVAVPPQDMNLIADRINVLKVKSNISLPQPKTYKQSLVKNIKPKVEYHFKEVDGYSYYIGHVSYPVLDIMFNYEGNLVSITEDRPKLFALQDDKYLEIDRNFAFEKKIYKQAQKGILVPVKDIINKRKEKHLTLNYDRFTFKEASDFRFSVKWFDALHYLEEEIANDPNSKIVIEESFPFQIISSQDGIVSFNDVSGEGGNYSSGIDWFDFNYTIEVDGKVTSLLPYLIKVLQLYSIKQLENITETFLTLKIEEKKYIKISLDVVLPILKMLQNLYEAKNAKLQEDGSIRLSKSELALLEEIEKARLAVGLRIKTGEKMKVFIEKIKQFSSVRMIETPKTLKAELRSYQKEGLAWLNFLREYGFGGILADDMGLGKTLQSLAWIAYEKENNRLTNPVIVIAPTSLMFNWMNEIEKFVPSLKVTLLHGLDRKKEFATMADSDVILTTYPLLVRDKEELLKCSYYAIILDEAQNIKNARAKNTQIIHQLKAEHRICLTGTPMENHLGELWSLFHFLQPNFLKPQAEFNNFYRKEIEKNGNIERQKYLMNRLKPFMLRRTKQDVVKELPPKTEILTTIELSQKQAQLYEAVRLTMQQKVQEVIEEKGIAKSQIYILDALLKMRQVCCHPELLSMEQEHKVTESAKLDRLMELLPDMVEEGRKILIFSSFTSMLEKIEDSLKEEKLEYVKLTGQSKNRMEIIEKFQSGSVPIFLISLKAGGVGLNLTAADTVIHYDPWWNPAVENQATDRAYRIGQDKPVFVYKFITKNTIEEKILILQEKKKKLADAIFSETKEGRFSITDNDLKNLFSV